MYLGPLSFGVLITTANATLPSTRTITKIAILMPFQFFWLGFAATSSWKNWKKRVSIDHHLRELSCWYALIWNNIYIYKSTIAFAAKLLDRMLCGFLCVIYQLCFQRLKQRLRFYIEILFLCKYVIADMHKFFQSQEILTISANQILLLIFEKSMNGYVVVIFYQYIFQSCDIGLPKRTYHI